LGFLQECFGEKSLLAKKQKNGIFKLISINSHMMPDTDFGLCILGLVDLSLFQFCDVCLQAKSIDDVYFSPKFKMF